MKLLTALELNIKSTELCQKVLDTTLTKKEFTRELIKEYKDIDTSSLLTVLLASNFKFAAIIKDNRTTIAE